MSPQTGSLAQAGRCKWHKMVSAERGGDTAGAVRVVLTSGSEAGRKSRQRDGGRDLLSCRAQQVRQDFCGKSCS